MSSCIPNAVVQVAPDAKPMGGIETSEHIPFPLPFQLLLILPQDASTDPQDHIKGLPSSSSSPTLPSTPPLDHYTTPSLHNTPHPRHHIPISTPLRCAGLEYASRTGRAEFSTRRIRRSRRRYQSVSTSIRLLAFCDRD